MQKTQFLWQKHLSAVISGRNSYLAGRMQKKILGSPSSPTKGLI